MGAYQTKLLANVLKPRFEEIYLVTKGFPKTNVALSFESMPLFLREEEGLKFEFKVIGNKDVRKNTLGHGFEIMGACTIYDSSVATFRNLLRLSEEPIQVFAKSVDGVFLNFTGDGIRLSMVPKLIINEQKRCVEITFTGQLTNSEVEALIADTAAFETGESGGVSLGLTEVTDTRSKYVQPGWANFLAGVDTSEVNMGEFEDAELTIEPTGTPLNKGRVVNRMVKVTQTIKGKQNKMADLGGLVTHSAAEWTFKAVDRNPTPATWTFKGIGVDGVWTISEGNTYGGISFTLEAEYPMNPDWATPAFIDLSVPAAPVFTNIY